MRGGEDIMSDIGSKFYEDPENREKEMSDFD